MGSTRLAVFTVMVLLMSPCVSIAAETDLSSLIPQYPRSELVEFTEDKEIATHEIMMGALKKSGGIVEPEASEYVVGRRVASTWYIPNEQRTEVVSDFFKDRLKSKGEIVFECKGYGCGSSNYWANNVFKRAILYGPEEYQHYFLTRIDGEGTTWYVATYVALRGTRKLYAHTDIVIVESAHKQAGGAAIVRALESDGKYVIDVGEEDKTLDGIVEAMQLEPLFRIAVVQHARKQQGESVPQAIARSEEMARRYVAKLVARGVNSSRVQAYGVGPLAPVNRDVVDRLELVLISSD